MADLQELYHKLDRIIELLEALVGYEPKYNIKVVDSEGEEIYIDPGLCNCNDQGSTAKMGCPVHG